MNYDISTPKGMANSVAWTKQLFNMMIDGAVWHVPRSLTRIRVFKSKKEVEVTRGLAPDDSIERVIKAMGWTVTIL